MVGECYQGQLRLEDLQRQLSLEDLAREAATCRRCALAARRRTVVFGEGDPYAGLMFIGEGPGEEEDRQGRPFVGPAGQLLDRILVAAGIRREEVYIANIVKCRPPANRVPTRAEAEACLPWLHRQIAVIRPRIIVLLGNTALQNLMGPTAGITRCRGQWLDFNGIRVLPTYHPAALLRDAGKKRPVWQDIQKVRDEYRRLRPFA